MAHKCEMNMFLYTYISVCMYLNMYSYVYAWLYKSFYVSSNERYSNSFDALIFFLSYLIFFIYGIFGCMDVWRDIRFYYCLSQ